MKTLFMESTEIEAERTAGEIASLLVQSGARRLMTEYDENREITGLRFELDVKGKAWQCVLPARIEPIFKILNGRRKYSYDRTQKAAADMKQAKRVAWRQLLRWVQAQFAMIDAGMVETGEVFLPYVEVERGVSFFQKVTSDPARLIEAPGKSVTAVFIED